MTSEVEICNAALINLGESTITALTEDSKAARLCNQRYAPLRDAVLRDAKWNFSLERVALALLVASPAFGYSNQFQLPSDLLRFLTTDDDLNEHKIEGGKLLTDAGAISILYIKRVTDPNEFDSAFVEALAARIAMDLAIPLVDDKGLLDRMTTLYKEKLGDAKSMDSQENGSVEEFEADLWINSRI